MFTKLLIITKLLIFQMPDSVYTYTSIYYNSHFTSAFILRAVMTVDILNEIVFVTICEYVMTVLVVEIFSLCIEIFLRSILQL